MGKENHYPEFLPHSPLTFPPFTFFSMPKLQYKIESDVFEY